MKGKINKLRPLGSYAEACRRLFKFTDYELMAKIRYSQKAYNLKRMRQLLESVNNPQNLLRCIHIAGTKGKGSTAIMLAAILAQAGYKTGLYTSPHLADLRERIQIWSQKSKTLISKNDFTGLMNHILAFTKAPGLKPTFFELMTALGFLHFAANKTDWAVIEVGLGGRLDATNIINPAVSVITRIDFDHMNKLGRTLSQIASEKAGIIKPGVPIISFRQKTAADKIIRSASKKLRAPLCLAGISNHQLPVLGRHQSENWSLALKTIEELNRLGLAAVNPTDIKSALNKLELPGRMEQLSVRPAIIIDSAHNPVSFRATCETARQLAGRPIVMILALSADKEAGQITRLASELTDIIILTKTDHPRLLEPQKLIKHFPYNPDRPILLIPNHLNALKTARQLAGQNGLILITGSFYLAGEMKKLLNTNRATESY